MVQGLSSLLRLGQSDDSFMCSLKEILHDRMILLQECLHLLNQVLGLFLGPLVLISQAVYFFIKVLLNRFKLNMEAFFV